MAVYYVSSTVSLSNVGTVDTIGDPYGIEAVLLPTNPAGLTQADQVVVLVDGTYSPTQILGTPIGSSALGTALNQIRAGVSGTGAPTLTRAQLDFTGLATGFYGFYINDYGCNVSGLHVYNTVASGFRVGSTGDASFIWNCEASDCGGDGFDCLANADHVYAYCYSHDNGGYGFDIASSYAGGQNALYKCYAVDNNQKNFRYSATSNQGTGNVFGCVSETTASYDPGAADFGHFHHQRGRAIWLDCTARQLNTGLNTTRDVYGFETVDTIATAIMVDCLASGMTNAGTGTGYGIYGGIWDVIGGVVLHGCDTQDGSNSVVTDYDGGTYDSTDPDFVSTTDNRPQVDLSGVSLFPAVAGEADSQQPGALPAASGGGGGGLLIHPGMSGGLRG